MQPRHTYNVSIGSFAIAANTTLYFIVTADITASGTDGNTVKVNGASNPVSFTYNTAPIITNNQTDVTAPKTILVADVSISSVAVPAGNVTQSSTNNVVYIAKVDVANASVTNTAMQFTLTGTHDATDLANVKVYSNATPSLSGAVSRNTISAAFAAPHAYNVSIGSFAIAANTTLYFIVTADVSASGTDGNTIKVNGASNPVSFTYNTVPIITNTQTDAAAPKTILVAGVSISSESVAAGNISQSSTNNVVYIAKVDVANASVTNTAMQFTLTGTHDATDLANVKVYTNTTPSLSGAASRNTVSAAFAAPHTYNVSIGSFAIAANTTLYFIITADVTASGTGGNTVKVDGAANPVSFTYNTVPIITNIQGDSADAKTIQVAGVTLSSLAVAASNILPASTNNVIYVAKVAVTDVAVTNTAMQFTLTGTHDATDLTNVKVFTNTTPSLSGAVSRNTVSAAFAAPHTYNVSIGSFSIAAGATLYFMVTADVAAAGTIGNTVKLDGAANPVTFTYTTAPPITNIQGDSAGVKTIDVSLPLTLLHFTGNVTNTKEIKLDWQTANETNTKAFEVEWSGDGLRFNVIDVIAAAGNSITNKQYGYLHRLPVSGNNFYRLKMVDIDGRFTYSSIVKIAAGDNIKITVYPNPVMDRLQIQLQAVKNEATLLGLYDAAGKMVATKSFSLTAGNNQLIWNLEAVAAGSYFIGSATGLFSPVSIKVVR